MTAPQNNQLVLATHAVSGPTTFPPLQRRQWSGLWLLPMLYRPQLLILKHMDKGDTTFINSLWTSDRGVTPGDSAMHAMLALSHLFEWPEIRFCVFTDISF